MIRPALTARPYWIWAGWVTAALSTLSLVDGPVYGVLVPASALALAATPGSLPARFGRSDHGDLLAIAVLYVAVVGLLRLAFVGFGTDNVTGLFLAFAAVLLVGVAGPVVYMVWGRGRSVADLGLRMDNWRPAAGLGLLFAAVQFTLTLWGYDLPAPVDWVPLLVMALVVGVFESIFFRGFVQIRLEDQFGPGAGVAGAAALYGLYHIGYGMSADEIVFLFGLGVVYGVAFALARNVLVVWPLLTPLGSFFANLEAADIELPWASIAGFADILAVMLAVLWLARRHERHRMRGALRPASAGNRTDVVANGGGRHGS